MLKFATRSTIYSVLTAFLLSAQFASAGALDQIKDPALRGKIKATIDKGETYAMFGNEEPWPSATVYKLVHASPEECIAIFSDYENQPNFIPSVGKVEVLEGRGTSTQKVKYTLNLPWPFNSQSYTVIDKVSSYLEDSDNEKSLKQYLLKWSFVEASSMDNVSGFARFEHYGSETLLVYHNYVVPNFWGSGTSTAINKAKEGMVDTTQRIAGEIEKQKGSNSEYFQKRMEEFKKLEL